MTLSPGLFTSSTDEWATPQDLFEALHAEFGFEVDVCATPANAKCPRYFTREQDALKQAWRGVCWMNPPYGNPEFPCDTRCTKKACRKRGLHNPTYQPGIIDWMRKAWQSAQEGATVVCLVPARTDTAWWHDYATKGAVRFIRGRLKFGDGTGSAPFPSAIVVFRPERELAMRHLCLECAQAEALGGDLCPCCQQRRVALAVSEYDTLRLGGFRPSLDPDAFQPAPPSDKDAWSDRHESAT